MVKTASEIKAEIEAEIQAEERRLREAQQQAILSESTLVALRAMHGPLNGMVDGNGVPRKRGRPRKQP